MKRFIFLLIYNLLLPVFLVLSIPGYLIKMKKRGGFGTGLRERFGLYKVPASAEPKGGLYVHAVSVGEVFIALKFIREWVKTHHEPVVLATSTATGHQVVRDAALPGVRALYSPLDVPGLSGRCLRRFMPKAVVLIEAELWPNFAEACHRMRIPMLMLNARLSPRSEGRYRKVRGITGLLFSRLTALGAQNAKDKGRFGGIGVNEDIISVTGSIKFDVLGDTPAEPRSEFRELLATVSGGKPVVLAASTHAGEEALIATSIRQAGAFPLIVPRHAERRADVVKDLAAAGFTPVLRTAGTLPSPLPDNLCYVADTTGELRDWTALADVAVIGKSYLARGGQNPVEAIAARVPVVFGPDMTNFADLVTLLKAENGVWQSEKEQLADTLRCVLSDKEEAAARCERAYNALHVHSGATARSVKLVETQYS
ncbi:MAG: glycosyltransferase N-terminal domain-containing protein [Akkermansia sp.]|nr:glycosyltransferase N-terminal domain-containing protein [Akkermansia sp.]